MIMDQVRHAGSKIVGTSRQNNPQNMLHVPIGVAAVVTKPVAGTAYNINPDEISK
jgi:hypothetical protein